MKNIFFVRHAESEENSTGILSDWSSPLSEKGRKESAAIAARVKKLSPDALIASHFRRAQETAKIIGQEVGLVIDTYDFLHENIYPSKNIGRGKRDADVLEEVFFIHGKYYEDAEYKHEDAESFNELKTRGQKTLELIRSHAGENIVVVSHGLFIRFLVGLMLFGDKFSGREYTELLHGLTTNNTGITWCRYDQSFYVKPWKVITWNDHNHLADTDDQPLGQVGLPKKSP